ncbi:Pilus assembly protein, PilP [compost metagenome]
MKSVKYLVSYSLVAFLGLGLAFFASTKFMAPARSQNAPSAGDLPPEFMNEVEKTQVPAATPTPAGSPNGATKNEIPPPPASNGQPEAPNQGEDVSDGMTAPQPVETFVPPATGIDGYVYDPTGKRDPFKPFKEFRAPKDGDPKVVALEPLQRWDLDRLQIVGILWEVKTPRAMVKDPDGAVYTIIKNSKIGRSEGFVAAIREGEVVVIETQYTDGEPIKETRVLEFKK